VKHLGTVAAVAVALAGVARGVPPPNVSWQDASHYVGEIVTVERDVAEARTTGNTCVLEFAPDDPRAFRAILLLPLLTSLPQQALDTVGSLSCNTTYYFAVKSKDSSGNWSAISNVVSRVTRACIPSSPEVTCYNFLRLPNGNLDVNAPILERGSTLNWSQG